ncbi:complex I subunit 5 family protein [Alitabrizicola rongguiensis]|uniref:complex I subunit 5 family protein n=1 Tax=Alitabrizicola rongguiensis TaxID=2909234 RepID=UPI001F45D8B3|nr:proton-conducting transporter membrane subunit [Tabrizicola rongguiensis]
MPYATTPGGWMLVLALMLPVVGMLGIFALGLRHAERIAHATLLAGLAVALAIAVEVGRSGQAVTYLIGGWRPPLGIALQADGLSAVLMVMTSVILCSVGVFARGSFSSPPDGAEVRRPFVFWTLLLGLWSALNTVWLAQDLFSLFVALELLTFSAVPLVCLDGSRDTLRAALRYLLFALAGSVFYLMGTGLIYGAYGTMDIASLHQVARADWATSVALGLMIVGLMAKAALFPLHLWLPPAHAGAPAAASAVLSALVVKAPFILILRLWFDVAPQPLPAAAGAMLAGLGAASILFCSIMALRQARLKLMIAYSTVAQVGYLFLVFPLVMGSAAEMPWDSVGWTGGVLQLVSHAFAKAAMFLAAGLIAEALGHDRIADLGGAAKGVPVTVAAFALAGLSLMGLPPAGGFISKLMLLTAAVETANWWIAATILAGGILAATYVFRVVGSALAQPRAGLVMKAVPLNRELAVLTLALIAVALGFLPLQPLDYLGIGRGGMP